MSRYPIERSLHVVVDERGPGEAIVREPAVPLYLQQVYWWAYVHPNAVHVFEREWLVNAILFGNYGRLRDAALADLGSPVHGHTLQVACAYGNLTARLQQRLAADARLDVVDILPIQLQNLGRKLPADERLCLVRGDSAALACADASYDQVLLFFLLHEQPEAVRRATLSEAMRVVRPGGKIVIVDYHRPSRWHPMRSLMRLVFRKLEPYAIDLWDHEIAEFVPADAKPASLSKRTYFGGLYQKLVLIR
jgi:ubiquinone/menaquinone biosynthesis C-methylase UbiE